MENLQDKIIELMDLFDGEVTTADKIDRPQSSLDREAFDDFNTRNPMAGGGMLVQPSADGSRPGYDGRKNRKVSYDTENKIVREYNKYLTDEITSGNMSKSLTFKSWLKENKEPAVFEKTYNAHSKNLLDVKPSKLTDAKIGFVKAFVERANEQGQFVEKKRILELIGRTQTPGVSEKNVYVETIIKEINKLDSREDKVHKAFNKLFNNELVFVTDPDFYKKFPSDKEAGSITRMLIQETGLTGPTIRKHRATWKKGGSKVPFFNTKKGKEQLKIIEHMNLKMGKVGESTFNGFNFNDLLEYGANSKKGGMYYKAATGSDFYRDPNNVVREFVVRHFDHNSKFGDKSKLIKVFKKGTNTEVKYEAGKRLIDFDFTYQGKRYGSNELAKEYLKWTRGESTPFKEVYDNHKLYTDFLRKPVNIGDPSVKNIGDLFRLAGHQGMAIEHGSLGGVAEEPFKNLKLLSSRANSELGTILQYYKNFPKVQKLLVNEFIKELPVNENYIDALAKNEIKIAKDMLKNGNTTIPMTYNQAAKNVLTNKNIKNFSPTELLTVSKSAFGPEIGYKSFVGVGSEKFENITTQNQLKTVLASLGDGTCAVTFGPKKRDGGRIGYQNGTPGLNQCIESGVKNFKEGKFKTKDQAMDAARLLGGGKNVLRAITKYGILPEVAFVAGESIFRTLLGEKPLNALKKSIDSFTSIIPPLATDFTSDIEAEEFGKDADRKFAVDKFRASQDKVNQLEKYVAGLEQIGSDSKSGYGVDYSENLRKTKEKLEAAKKELKQNYVNPDLVQYIDRKAENIADAKSANAPLTKARFEENMKLSPSNLAKARETSQMDLNINMLPNFQEYMKSDEAQKNKLFMYAPDKTLMGLFGEEDGPAAIEYKNQLKDFFKMENLKNIFGGEQIYGTQAIAGRPVDLDMSNLKEPTSSRYEGFSPRFNEYKPMVGGGIAKSGRAGFKLGSVRKGVLSLIEEGVKKTPKNITTDLDKLIKKTLDEDFLDKKDKIIDTLNAKIAKERKNYPYNVRVFEEPSQLEFYDDITKSNFRTKTGEYFDRIRRRNKAGGGILKQAGVDSGPPPESGPNPQGLQGLLNRVKKT